MYKHTDSFIAGADSIKEVWPRFQAKVESYLGPHQKVGMLLAWSGKGGDCGKIFELVEEQYKGELEMPNGVLYFCDPVTTIKEYKTCKLNESKRTSHVVGYGLGTVYEEAFGEHLEGAHSSIVDARAQAKIVSDKRVKEFIDRTKSVTTMEAVWSGKQKNKAQQRGELTRAVPLGWDDGGEKTHALPWQRSYSGPQGGGQAGPSSAVTSACSSRNLSDLFMFFFTPELLNDLAEETNRYGSINWVRPVSNEEWRVMANDDKGGVEEGMQDKPDYGDDVALDLSALDFSEKEFFGTEIASVDSEYKSKSEDKSSKDDDASSINTMSSWFTEGPPVPSITGTIEDDGSFASTDASESSDDDTIGSDFEDEPKRRVRLIPCKDDHPDKRKRIKNEDQWIKVTPGYILCWFGVCCIIAALKLRSWRLAWMESYGVNINFIQNAMKRDAFDQLKRYWHFVDTDKLVKKGHSRWNPLQKIMPFLTKVQERLRLGYIMGRFFAGDESMILYKGKAVQFVQYMPAKPIKHGIKVFALCCAETGYIYAFYVYTGKENDSETAAEIIDRLLEQDPNFLNNSNGRVLYTDNYYTSEELMELIFDKYGILLVGTVSLSKKKSRSADDYPFHKLSGGAKKLTNRGWIRWAQKERTGRGGNTLYIVQATTWMDRKQVGILHNHKVGPPGEFRTMRYDREARERVPVDSHEIIPDYIQKMRGVDRIDRSMGDYTISMKGNRWYLRIFYYCADAVLACMRIVTHMVVEQSSNKDDPWAKYLKGSKGNFKWMMDTGLSLMEKGILMDWADLKSHRPAWMRQAAFKPCSCKRCFFCKNNLTGPYGPPSSSSPRKRRHQEEAKDHVTNRVKIFPNPRDCGECIAKQKVRKPKGVSNDGAYINKSFLGCPHPNCENHPICKECWSRYKHK